MHTISLHLVLHAFAATLMWWELNWMIQKPNRALVVFALKTLYDHTRTVHHYQRTVWAHFFSLVLPLSHFKGRFKGLPSTTFIVWIKTIPVARCIACWVNLDKKKIKCQNVNSCGTEGVYMKRVLLWHARRDDSPILLDGHQHDT
jgi:hypothetical protein